jgi:hypothetical protein
MRKKFLTSILAILILGLGVSGKPGSEFEEYLEERKSQMERLKGKWESTLAGKIKEADHIRLESTPFGSREGWGQFLYTINGNDKVHEFIDRLEVDEEASGGHCMCDGDALIVFKKGEETLGRIGFHHGLSLRWHAGEWAGDAALTKKSSKRLAKWFLDEGFYVFYRSQFAGEGYEARRKADEARFKSFYTDEEYQILTLDFKGRTPSWAKGIDPMTSEKLVGHKLFHTVDDPVDFAVRAFYSLGVPLQFDEMSNTFPWWNAIHAATNLTDEDFRLALERVHDDTWGVLGAKEPFFRGGYYKRFDPEEREYWTLWIAGAALANGNSYEKEHIVKAVAALRTDKSKEFLYNVIQGKVGRINLYTSENSYHGNIISTSCLALALNGDPNVKQEILKAMEYLESPQDISTLKVALGYLGQFEHLTLELYDSNSMYVQEAFLKAVEKSREVEKVELLVTMMRNHFEEDRKYYVGDDVFIAFEEAVGTKLASKETKPGRRWFPQEEDLRKAIDWWEENKERLRMDWEKE